MQLELTDLSETASDAPISQTHQADPSAESPSEGILHYKYMPRTGEWGTSDCEYAVLTPATGSHARQLRHSSGQGRVMWNRARWEDMPTQYNIVNGIADLEVRQWLGATITETVGGKDLSDQRILR